MPDEAALIEQAKAHMEGAFDSLVRPYLTRAYRTACLITHQEEQARDALQEALVRAYLSMEWFRSGSSFYTWFIRIVVHEGVRQATRHRREASLPLPEPTDRSTPEARVLAQENRSELWSAIQALSPHHRAVIVLRYYEGLTEAEMAAVLGVSPGTVKSRLSRARRSLQRQLNQSSTARPTLGPLEVAGGMTRE